MAYTDIDKPLDHFETKIWTGNGSSQNISLDFAPNWVWIKQRSATRFHNLQDTIRGVGLQLFSNANNADNSDTANITAFNSDGYSLGSGDNVNKNSSTYVGWSWKAGTSFSNDASSTSVGSIDSSGSTSTTAGFSIVKIDGLPAGTTSTFAHNLGVKPDFIIFKSRNLTTNWDVYHSSALPDGERKLYLNGTDAVIDSGFMTDTPPTSSVVSFNPGSNDSNHIAYCFAEKQGYSKFGSYVGNGNADGTYVYTGFKPAFVICKRAVGGTGNWGMNDTKRDPFSGTSHTCDANEPGDADDVAIRMDILSNGFKLKTNSSNWNTSGDTYIFMAFAEHPFVTSTGIPTPAR